MGYDNVSKVYRIYILSERKIQLSRDVVFDESKIGFNHFKKPLPVEEEIIQVRGPMMTDSGDKEVAQLLHEQLADTFFEHQDEEPNLVELPPVAEEEVRLENEVPEEAPISIRVYRRRPREVVQEQIRRQIDDQQRDIRNVNGGHHRRYPNRERRPASRLRDYLVLSSEIGPEREPQSFAEAIQSEGWREAIASEIESIKKNQTWEVVDLPEGKNTITAKWIFKEKRDASEEVRKLKARLVAKLYEQIPGEDFYETFAPVVRWSTIKTTLAIAAQKRWKMRQLDVKTTFLNGILEDKVYMEIPEGFIEPGMEGKVVRLKRALYGLKQAL